MAAPTHRYIRLHSGLKFYPDKPTIKMINLEDIIWSLSHINRFLGHTDKPISVLRHVIHVHDIAPEECKKEALHHDNSESLIGDVVTNVKALLPTYKDMEIKVEKIIARKFNLIYPYPAAVKIADLTALADEMVQFTSRKDWMDLPFPPSGKKIELWTPEKTRKEFMKRHNALYT
jgi:hypothetical protein